MFFLLFTLLAGIAAFLRLRLMQSVKETEISERVEVICAVSGSVPTALTMTLNRISWSDGLAQQADRVGDGKRTGTELKRAVSMALRCVKELLRAYSPIWSGPEPLAPPLGHGL